MQLILDESPIPTQERELQYHWFLRIHHQADKYAIKWQPEILTGGGTDTMGLQQYTAGGSIAGAISVPTRHIHQVIETCNRDDIMHSINLLVSCVQEIDDYNWSH